MDLSNENVVHIQKNGIEYLQFRKLLEYKDIINHAYSLGVDKNYRTSSESDYTKALQDYKNLCKAIESNEKNLVKTNQEHTDRVKIVTQKFNLDKPDFNLSQYSKTDGLITNKKNLILATTNADCILLLFFDPVKKVIANTHSGWRGTLQRISVKTVQKMQKEFDCKPENIICCIAPSIRKCHFEVEEEVKNEFLAEFQDIKQAENLWITETIPNKKWNIDTVKINQILLKKQGLKEENIIDSGICSVCNSNLIHSFRVEKAGYGLNTAIIELK